MAMIHVQRSTLVRMLLAHDEQDLIERVPSMTDDQLQRIGQRAGYLAFGSEDAQRYGSMGGSRAISVAAVEVLEGAPRELCRDVGERQGPAAEEDALVRLGLFVGPPGVAAEAERRAARDE
jgi:hypothetical protein